MTTPPSAEDLSGAVNAGSLASTTLPYFTAEAMTALASIGGVVAFTRLVTPEVYGEFALVVAASMFAMSVAGEWLQVSAVRFAGRGEHRSAAIGALMQWLIVILLLLATIGAAGWWWLPATVDRATILAGTIFCCLMLAFLTLTSLFQANLEAWRFAAFRSVFAGLRILLPIAVVLMWQRSAVALIGGQILAISILLPFVLSSVVSGLTSAPLTARRAQGRAVVSFGGPLVAWYGASQLLNLSDRFFLQAWEGSEVVGLYAVNYALVMGAVATTLQPILSGIYPLMVRSWYRGGASATQIHFTLVLRLFALLAPALWGVLWFFGGDVISILAPAEYHAPQAVVGLIAAGILCWYGGLYIQKALELDLRSHSIVRVLWIAAIINLGCNFLLVPRYGMVGAGIATAVGYSSYLVLTLFAADASMTVRLPGRLGTSVVMAFGVMFVSGIAIKSLLGDLSPMVRLPVGATVISLGYVAMLIIRGEHRITRTA